MYLKIFLCFQLKKSQEFGNFSEEDFKQAFHKHSGDVDLILQDLFTPSLDEYEKRIWAMNEPLNRSLSADLINLLKDNQIDVQVSSATIPSITYFIQISIFNRKLHYIINLITLHPFLALHGVVVI